MIRESGSTSHKLPRGRSAAAQRGFEAKKITVCDACCGSRLNEDALSLQWEQRTIDDLSKLECSELLEWVQLAFTRESAATQSALKPPFDQVVRRLQMLIDLGLGYLSLHRPLATLSGGESQRAALTSVLASGLINTLYILDEPTAGLHPNDTDRVLEKIRALQGRGNTVVVVEHDPTVILAADEVIEIGPGAGNDGGQLVFQGSPNELLTTSTATARKLAERSAGDPTPVQKVKRRKTTSPEPEPKPAASKPRLPEHWLELRGVNCHNLTDLNVRLPLGVFCSVIGVSGSGKSSLIAESLYPELLRRLASSESIRSTHSATEERSSQGRIDSMIGIEKIENVMLLDQSPIPRTRRSIPATWIGIFDDIRILLAETHEGKKRNFSRAMFSFNAANGADAPFARDAEL